MYVCGPNVYAPAHVGHAMSYIVFDVLRRYLEYCGYKVKHVQNFTDIEDNIINRARAEGISIDELAERHIEQFFEDMAPLNVLKAHIYPRATHELPAIIEMVQRLIDNGHAYEAGGDVYFRVNSRSDYGKLSARDLDSMLAGARIQPGENKEHPGDFVLWKASKPGEPAWDSPWGKGRPGWHIECSAMSLKYLGHPLDIQLFESTGRPWLLLFTGPESSGLPLCSVCGGRRPGICHQKSCGEAGTAGDESNIEAKPQSG